MFFANVIYRDEPNTQRIGVIFSKDKVFIPIEEIFNDINKDIPSTLIDLIEGFSREAMIK